MKSEFIFVTTLWQVTGMS